jgi:AraC-like DNA-binding protein
MSEPIAKHEIFKYEENLPIIVRLIPADADIGDSIMNHWHKDLEIAYIVAGNSRHYINGECIVAQPGRLIVTNSECIHSIIPDSAIKDQHILSTILLIIKPEFLQQVYPEYKDIYFRNDKLTTRPEIEDIMKELANYHDGKSGNADKAMYLKGKVMELLYYMIQEGVISRSKASNINIQKNIERMRGVISFIENHYKEPITQAKVAEKFYFSTVYFSKYFKKCTGMTFTDYLTYYRVEMARQELISTKKSISQIAMDNGFSDERRFILGFKKYYQLTPLRYRKVHV